jgi:hypothetical protein
VFGTASFTRRRSGVSWLTIIYLIVGAIVAASHHYWQNIDTWKTLLSAVLATILWPLLLLGINLHVH